jgi:hypothetical protein
MSGPWELYRQNQKPQFAPTLSGQAIQPDPEVDRFFYGVAAVETGGTKNPYEAENPNSSAVGKYQFLWNQWGDAISKFAGEPVTKEQFKKNPELQERFARHYYHNVLKPEATQLMAASKQAPTQRGVSKIADAKLLIHFLGFPGAKDYATTGKMAEKAAAINKTPDEYLKKVKDNWANFDASKVYLVNVNGMFFKVPAKNLRKLLKDQPTAKIISEA